MNKLLPILSVLAAGPALAQSHVVPEHFARAEAPSATTTPTSLRQICVQQIFGSVPARKIRGIALRRDGLAGGRSPDMPVAYSIHVSTAGVAPENASPTFAANHGPDRTLVANNRTVTFQNTEPGPVPAPFLFRMPFSKEFDFNGGPLCIEIFLSTATPTGVALDLATGGASNPQPALGKWGVGCRYSAAAPRAQLGPNAGANWNSQPGSLRWGYGGAYLPPNGFATLLVGFSTTAAGSIALPFTLRGTAGATSGPCTVYTSPDIALLVPVGAAGSFTFSRTMELHPVFHGQSWFAQAAAMAPSANPLGVVLTNVVQHHVVAPFAPVDVTTVQVSPCGPTGRVRTNYGLVMELF